MHSGCYNKIAKTGPLRNCRNLFPTVLESGSLRLGSLYGLGRALLWVIDFSLSPRKAEGARELCGVSFFF